ncbi:UNVERIFIED_CONTAM: hypothetical protein K2H54_059971 [Gekko kuhli]
MANAYAGGPRHVSVEFTMLCLWGGLDRSVSTSASTLPLHPGSARACIWDNTYHSCWTKADCSAEQLQIHGNTYLCHDANDSGFGHAELVAHLPETVVACEPPQGYGHTLLWRDGLSDACVCMCNVLTYLIHQPAKGSSCDPEVLQPLLVLPDQANEGIPPVCGARIHPPASGCTLLAQST